MFEKEKVVDISILCKTYNHEKYVRKTLEGFMMQKGDFEYEILIHDDASTDGTRKILKEYKNKYPDKITLILQEENQYSQGIEIYRTFIYPLAKGKYIALCEGDDFWIYGRKLQKQYELMEANPNISLCYHNALVYREETDSLQLNVFNHPSGYIEDKDIICTTKGWYPTASFFGRTDYIKEQPELKAATVDEGLRTYMACKGDLYFINGAWSVYREFASGSWNEKYRKDKTLASKYIEDIVSYFTKFDDYSKNRFSDHLHTKYMQAVRRFFGVNFGCGYTVEQFEDGLEELRSASGHSIAHILEEFHDEYIIWSIDYYEYTVKNKINELFHNGYKLYIYGAGAEAVKAVVVLMRWGINIDGFIVTKKKDGMETLLGYPIHSIEEMKFFDNMYIWPCLIDGREEVLETLNNLPFCKLLI